MDRQEEEANFLFRLGESKIEREKDKVGRFCFRLFAK